MGLFEDWFRKDGDNPDSRNFGTVLDIGIPLLGGYLASTSDSSFFNPEMPQVGYQGGIPDYTAVRTTVPDTYDPDRRPGSGGQRYFTDVQYVPSDATEAVYDWGGYLAGNPDVAADYELNMDELIAGGDPRFSTPEGYAQYHWETFGQDEGRTPPEVIQASGIDQAWDTAGAQATALAEANYLNPAKEQNWDPDWYMEPWVTDAFNELVNNPDWTDEEKAAQLRGALDRYNVSPYMLSESVGIPVNQIYELLNKTNTSPYTPLSAGDATPSYAERAGYNYLPEQDTGEEPGFLDDFTAWLEEQGLTLDDLNFDTGTGTDTTTGGTGTDTITGGTDTGDGLDPTWNFTSHFTPESREAWEVGGDLYSQTFGDYSVDTWDSLFPEANLEGGPDAVGQWGEDYLSRSRMNQMMSDVQELGQLRATDPTAYDAAYQQFADTYMTETGNAADDEMLRRLRQIANGADLDAFMDAVTSGLAEQIDTTDPVTDDGGSGGWDYTQPGAGEAYDGLVQLLGNYEQQYDGRYSLDDIASIIDYSRENDLTYEDVAQATGYTVEQLKNTVEHINTQQRTNYFTELLTTSNLSQNSIQEAMEYMDTNNITPEQIASLTGFSLEDVNSILEAYGITYAQEPTGMAAGGYLGGAADGMGDTLPTTINNAQPAALSHGEFVIPADVVSHMGNGNSEAGAQQLYNMMDRVRQARTGTAQQGPQINPRSYMPV